MLIIMLGAPASGKGSVAGILSEHYNIPAISSGDIFRKHVSENTEIGKEINSYISKGNLVPDEIVLKMLKERLEEPDVQNGAILDGFIRTVKQAEIFDEMLKQSNDKIDIVIDLEAPEEEILDRIVTRRICTNNDCKAVYNLVLHPPKKDGICDNCGSPLEQREDDTLEKAKIRLEVYHKETEPLIEYYSKTGVLYKTVLSSKANRLKDVVSKEVIEYLSK